MKRIFDPDMFNFQWESIDHDRYIVGTYYLEDRLPDQEWIEHLGQVQRLALEGSTSSWMRVKEDSGVVREKLTSKVLGYFEVPTDKPHTKAAILQLGFPIDAWDINLNVPMMLLTIAGNAFAFSNRVRLLDVYFPVEVANRFKGPKYGIPGIRERLGVYDRPLVLHIIKPKMGMTPEETANQVYQTALGGADLCKDDEMLSDLASSPWEKRLEAVLKAIEGRLTRIKPGAEITPGIVALDTTGHTPGHISLLVGSGAEKVLVTADAIQNAHVAFAHPDWQPRADMDGATAAKSRRRLLDMAAQEKLTVLSYHIPFPGLGRVESRGGQYLWVPAHG